MHSALIGGQTQIELLEWAHDLKMTDGTYVFVPYDALLYSLPYKHTPYQVLRNNPKLREAYDAVLTITMESQEKTFYQAYTEAATRGEIPEKLELDQVSGFTSCHELRNKIWLSKYDYFYCQHPVFRRQAIQ